jgi:hypothetical protein
MSRQSYFYVLAAFLSGIAMAVPTANGQLMDWGKGPHWSAYYEVTNCETPIPPDYVAWGNPCSVTFPYADINGYFYFSDDRPGLVLFESGQSREVRTPTFNSANSEFSVSRRSELSVTTLYQPTHNSAYEPSTLSYSGSVDYTFRVTSRDTNNLAGTFTVTRPIVALYYKNYAYPFYSGEHLPLFVTLTATGTWSAKTYGLPTPWMNGYDVCRVDNVAYNYSYPPDGHCNPTGLASGCINIPNGCDYHNYSGTGDVTLLNPLQGALQSGAYNSIDGDGILHAATATQMSADRVSAAVVALKTSNTGQVTFKVDQYAGLTEFKSDYLVNPNPGNSRTITVDCLPDGSGSCAYLALLWPPDWPDGSGNPLSAKLTVSATQSGANPHPATITLRPPPLLLVHGIWSSAKEAGFASGGAFSDWISKQYPPDSLIRAVDYGTVSNKAFGDSSVQDTFKQVLKKTVLKAAAAGTVARTVDVAAHSMGGLATRYFLKNPPPMNELPLGMVHKLVTVGTPHKGSELATQLIRNRQNLPLSTNPIVGVICGVPLIECRFEDVFAKLNHVVGAGGVESLVPGNPSLGESDGIVAQCAHRCISVFERGFHSRYKST